MTAAKVDDRRKTPEDRLVQISHKTAYGTKEFFYPVNQTSIALCELCGQTSFTKDQLRVLKEKLGYEIEVVVPGLEDIIGKAKK